MAKRKDLVVKRSVLPGAGKGLFTRVSIPKGQKIVEYKGKVTTWKDAAHMDGLNAYLFYVSRNHVIDANDKRLLGRYANDASGIGKVKAIRNNSEYVTEKKRVYIQATRDIAAGEEILVAYGKEYWDVIKANKQP